VRELRAVRVSDDGKEILLSEAAATSPGDPSFSLAADDRLRSMLRPRPAPPSGPGGPGGGGGKEIRPESALTPREIQARLRAGDTAEEVARAAGIPVARVARYEAPIAAERVRIVDEVRRATAPGPHRVSPGRALGAVVDDRLAEDGLDPALAAWVARRRPDSTWIVTVDLGNHHAEWSWDGAARRVRAHDAGAQQLLGPSRSAADSLIAVAQATGVTADSAPPRADAGERPGSDDEPPAPLAPARAVGETVVQAQEPSSSRPAARSGLVVLPGEGASTPAPSPTPPRAHTSAAPTLDDVPGAAAPVTPPADRATSWIPVSDDVPGAGRSGPPRLEPSASASDDEDPELPGLAAEQPAAGEGQAPSKPAAKAGKRRSAVPAWDDIVFGARRS
jgi:hypothetical protein